MKKGENSWGFDIKNLDLSARPQDDFFRYANGGWLKKNPIPPEESKWGSFYVLRKKSIEALHEILEDSKRQKARPGSNLQKVRDYYVSGMDLKNRNSEGAKPLSIYFEMINAVKNKEDIVSLSGRFRSIGIPSLWSVGADQDMKDRKIVRFYIGQGGLGLPDRDYYLKDDKKSKEIRKKYISYIEKMHRLVFKKCDKKTAQAIMKIETRLARASMTQVELRDYEKQYNKMSYSALKQMSPSVDWDAYCKEIGADARKPLIISQPLFIKEANKMLAEIAVADWKQYFAWKVINEFAGYLSEKLGKERFNFFGKTLSGIKKMKPQWERTAIAVDLGLGDALGVLYVKKYFPESAKKEIKALVNNLIAAYRERINGLGWMGKETKKKALDKLHAFQLKLGYPDKWKNYASLEITPQSYLENRINAYKYEFRREMRKIGKKPDKKEWGMTPPTVNAYNNYLFNEIVFPAGIMQPPFFHPDADDAVNYGGIGAVIGHELTHGFDDKGGTFDKNGEMKNWWLKKDKKLFQKKAQGLVDQYNKFEPLPGVRINGKLTLGENIADLGGLVISFYAFLHSQKGKEKKIIDGFTPEQRFFLGAAQAECGVTRDEALRLQINTDPHSPSKARVNLPLSNMTEFYDAFGIKKGDKMWRPEKDRVVIW